METAHMMTTTSARAPGMHASLARVCVVGTSGSGKTTFGRRLAAIEREGHVEVWPRRYN